MLDALRVVMAPDLGKDIVALGFVRRLTSGSARPSPAATRAIMEVAERAAARVSSAAHQNALAHKGKIPPIPVK